MKLTPFLLDLYHDASVARADALGQQALRQLRTHMHFDSAAIYSMSLFESQDMRFNACLSYGNGIEKIRYRLAQVTSERLTPEGRVSSQDRLIQRAMDRPGQTFAQDVTGIANQRLRDYAALFETRHAMLHTQRTGHHFALVSLWRAQAKRAYLQSEVALADQTLPHILNAMTLADKWATHQDTGASSPSCELITDLSGHIIVATPQARDWLALEWPEFPGVSLPPPLLNPLLNSPQDRYKGRRITARLERCGDVLRFRLERLQGHAELTASEQRVAALAAQGLSYKEIAREQGNSPATVRNQLHSVYGKLNIQGKAALAYWGQNHLKAPARGGHHPMP
ncbi:helix-turn-helix transcriptional regulator [Curvibacter sp. HBC28]|uniref:Helix-turn-helix transcriptional regulator n=1 Tax=Curvibacter microcysteis TaxID=3026419 RepID=A0ABT5MDR6_9BURK|nr:helix-turn-helix transcriptional regulator [Curvibacter sp. HBC28]MDD0814566.1 helix-turn-helix transcriptional regulator [Curvibacter sp. HBC28]